MKKILYRALVGLVLVFMVMNIGSFTGSAPCFAYVYSESMEPTLKINDAFIVIPARDYSVGDIIFFRPKKLDAEIVTHRIVAVGKEGFITRGDNASGTDQSVGEPEVIAGSIVGKVAVVGGKPVVIKKMGFLAAAVRSRFGAFSKMISMAAIFLGAVLYFLDILKHGSGRKSVKRWRLRDLYHISGLIITCIVMISVLLSSRTQQVRYLVSSSPGTRSDMVEIGKPGNVPVTIKNNGILPVWNVAEGISPLKVIEAPKWIPPRGEGTIIVEIPPHHDPGWYKDYVRVCLLPIIMPRELVICLCGIGTLAAVAGVCGSLLLWIALFIWIANRIPGMEGWIPLRALKDKIAVRRLRRIRSRLIGKRGVWKR